MTERRATRLMLLMILVGTACRLILAFSTVGNYADLLNSRWALEALRDGSPWDFYAQMEGSPRWPYLVGFAPWLFAADELSQRFGSFDGWLQVAPIAADAAIAWAVGTALRARGASERARLAAVALVAFGPPFLLISGHAFQIDSVAVLPALLALIAWERGRPGRALRCGLLAGLAVAVKPPLALAVLAMLPTVRTGREALEMLAAAALIPVALIAPFLLAEPAATVAVFRDYTGLSGQVGLTAIIQPSMTEIWLQTRRFGQYDPVLADIGGLLNLAVLAVGTAFAARRRLGALDTAALIAALLWTFGSGMTFAYLIWGLAFMLAGGRLALVAAISALAALPMLLLAAAPVGDTAFLLYRVDVYALYALFLVSVVILSRARGHGARARPLGPPSP